MIFEELPKQGIPILIIEDEISLAQLVQDKLSSEGYEVSCAHDAPSGLAMLDELNPYLVLLDLALPPSNSVSEGIGLFEKIIEYMSHTKVVIITGEGDLTTALECFKKGAADFIEKPLQINKLPVVIERVLRQRALEEVIYSQKEVKTCIENIIGASDAMQDVYNKIRIAASSDANILIVGETGTGKNLVARTIHNLSARKEKEFLEINCAGLAENLIESELFGHVRGAFSGAIQDKVGLFEAADKGTLLLDEIGVMKPALQAKLLHVLDNKQFRRVGSSKTITADVRIIAATNADLQSLQQSGDFRQDLYYRLNRVEIFIPPLRQRKGDLAMLTDHFFKQINQGRLKWIADECYRQLKAYSWPGNVRELKSAIEEAILGGRPGDILTPDLFPQELSKSSALIQDTSPPLKKRMEEFEGRLILDALETFDGKTEAARHLGITRQALWKNSRRSGRIKTC